MWCYVMLSDVTLCYAASRFRNNMASSSSSNKKPPRIIIIIMRLDLVSLFISWAAGQVHDFRELFDSFCCSFVRFNNEIVVALWLPVPPTSIMALQPLVKYVELLTTLLRNQVLSYLQILRSYISRTSLRQSLMLSTYLYIYFETTQELLLLDTTWN